MRNVLIITFIFIYSQLLAQSSRDTAIGKILLDSLQNLIFRFKDSARRLCYEYHVFTRTKIIDTVYAGQDSLRILHKSSSGKTLKRAAQAFRRPPCIMYETTAFLNARNYQSLQYCLSVYALPMKKLTRVTCLINFLTITREGIMTH